MTETRKWIISMIVSLLLAFGGNYWVTTVNQEKMDMRMQQVEKIVTDQSKEIKLNSDHVAENVIALTKVNQGWSTVVKAVDANTTQLTRFTEVLIRLEERNKLKSGI